jgi:hypothetical protein
MSGRGDNNKAGSAGRGARNQSGQAFGQVTNKGKSDHGDRKGGSPSEAQPKQKDQSSERNRSTGKG